MTAAIVSASIPSPVVTEKVTARPAIPLPPLSTSLNAIGSASDAPPNADWLFPSTTVIAEGIPECDGATVSLGEHAPSERTASAIGVAERATTSNFVKF